MIMRDSVIEIDRILIELRFYRLGTCLYIPNIARHRSTKQDLGSDSLAYTLGLLVVVLPLRVRVARGLCMGCLEPRAPQDIDCVRAVLCGARSQ